MKKRVTSIKIKNSNLKYIINFYKFLTKITFKILNFKSEIKIKY